MMRFIFLTQDGWFNFHPIAMLLHVLAVFGLFIMHTSWLWLAQWFWSAWLYWWVLAYLPVLILTEGKAWDPFWLYELWEGIPPPQHRKKLMP